MNSSFYLKLASFVILLFNTQCNISNVFAAENSKENQKLKALPKKEIQDFSDFHEKVYDNINSEADSLNLNTSKDKIEFQIAPENDPKMQVTEGELDFANNELIRRINSGKFIQEIAKHQEQVSNVLISHIKNLRNFGKFKPKNRLQSRIKGLAGGFANLGKFVWAKIIGSKAHKKTKLLNPSSHDSYSIGGVIGMDTKPNRKGFSYSFATNFAVINLILTDENLIDSNILSFGGATAINYQATPYLSLHSFTSLNGHWLHSHADSLEKPERSWGGNIREELVVKLNQNLRATNLNISIGGFYDSYTNTDITNRDLSSAWNNHKIGKNYAKLAGKANAELSHKFYPNSELTLRPIFKVGLNYLFYTSEDNSKSIVGLRDTPTKLVYLDDSKISEEQYMKYYGIAFNLNKLDSLDFNLEYECRWAEVDYHAHSLALNLTLRL